MFLKKLGLTIGTIALMFIIGMPWALGASKEIRPGSQMNGWITAPLEEGKQALSIGDKVLVALEQPRPVKKGDKFEIFQPIITREDAPKDGLMTKVGRGVVLEISDHGILLCVIESSIREIGVGDRIYWP
jgi:hypothetical protein